LKDGSSGSRSNAEIHDRTGLYLSIIAALLSAVAIGVVIVVPRLYEEQIVNLKDRVEKAERESRLAAQDAMLLKATMIAHGIPVNEDQLRKDDK